MKQFLRAPDYVLWLATFTLQWLLLAITIRQQMRGHLPRFVSYVGLLSIKTTALIAISQLLPYNFYFWTFYAGMAIETIMLVLVCHEIFDRVFQPVDTLPRGTIAKLITSLVAGVGMIVTFHFATPALSTHAATAFLRTAHRSANLVIALALWSLVVYARSLAIPWRSRVASIAKGFLVCMTANCFITAVVGFAPAAWFAWINRVYSVAFIVTLVMWLHAIARPEEVVTEVPTPASLRQIGAALMEMRSLWGSTALVGRRRLSEE